MLHGLRTASSRVPQHPDSPVERPPCSPYCTNTNGSSARSAAWPPEAERRGLGFVVDCFVRYRPWPSSHPGVSGLSSIPSSEDRGRRQPGGQSVFFNFSSCLPILTFSIYFLCSSSCIQCRLSSYLGGLMALLSPQLSYIHFRVLLVDAMRLSYC